MEIPQVRLDILRRAIRSNQISFPSQTPVFAQTRSDIQWRLAQLYFVRGWSSQDIGSRYRLTRRRIEQLLGQWVHSATTLGYLQEIPQQSGFPAVG